MQDLLAKLCVLMRNNYNISTLAGPHVLMAIGNTQISILLLCFLYLFVELMIMLNE